jgi:hypothetical protein
MRASGMRVSVMCASGMRASGMLTIGMRRVRLGCKIVRVGEIRVWSGGMRAERRDACDACEWDACQSYVYRCGYV